MIEFKNISKTFETDDGPVRAVQNVNLKINDGEVFGIVGFSGAGKSTLVRMLNGLETPTSGEVVINGKKINGLKGAELREQRKKIGTIFQHFNLLWSRTVLQNIEFPLELAGVDKKRAKRRLSIWQKSLGWEIAFMPIPHSFPEVKSSASELPEHWRMIPIF